MLNDPLKKQLKHQLWKIEKALKLKISDLIFEI
jgi:hypothetical protein